MKENYMYPVKLKETQEGCLVTVPDFPGQMTAAGSEKQFWLHRNFWHCASAAMRTWGVRILNRPDWIRS